MSERTTIGGTVYESIGSSSSNLLLKCNGTARIQWGNKLIDLIKNGKIASENDSIQLYIIKNESEINRDGIYVLNTENNSQLWVCKNGKHYDLTRADLCILANIKQNITAEQKEQALENIGMYYNTLQEVKDAGINNGLVYVLENSTLYTIKDGTITEFEAKLKTVTVEKEMEQGESINSSIKIVLAVSDDEYIILQDKRVTINYDVHVRTTAQLGSEGANESRGYRLFLDGDTSWLEVDKINVRDGIPNQEYLETTYYDLVSLIKLNQLQPHKWYLITDYQNPWKLPADNTIFNRPILIRALTTSSFYKEGTLFKDRRVSLIFDPFATKEFSKIKINDEVFELEEAIQTRGCITWMKDHNGNEANFDFLDYINYDEEPLTTLHESMDHESLDSSVFPKNSYNNKLIVSNLKGTFIVDDILDYDSANIIDFKYNDTKSEDGTFSIMQMHDNYIECGGFVLSEKCDSFCNNTLTKVFKLEVKNTSFNKNNLNRIYNTVDNSEITSFVDIDESVFIDVIIDKPIENVTIDGFVNSSYYNSITNSTFGYIVNCTLYDSFNKVTFKDLNSCSFGLNQFDTGLLENITCYSNIENYIFDKNELNLLYDVSKIKDVYYQNSELQVVVTKEQTFFRGMIVMHSGFENPPVGWAVCDGGTYTYDGVTSTTPDLRNRFIKGAEQREDSTYIIESVDNPDLTSTNEFTITKEHLPEHNHPHAEHTHELGAISGTIGNSGTLSLSGKYKDTFTTTGSTDTKIVVNTSEDGTVVLTSVFDNTNDSLRNVEISGGDHNHTLTVTGSTIKGATSTENSQTWENKAFKIEPNYYSLIFIMKL